MSSPIGGFMPIPLAMMIPFMATQSLVMGDAFGKGFQYGKRKISAMSNEEFNELTEVALASNMFKAYTQIIPDLQEAIKNSNELQSTVINTLLTLPFEALEGILKGIGKNLEGTPLGHEHDTSDEIAPGISEAEQETIRANQAKSAQAKTDLTEIQNTWNTLKSYHTQMSTLKRSADTYSRQGRFQSLYQQVTGQIKRKQGQINAQGEIFAKKLVAFKTKYGYNATYIQ